jgi:hypothetical protein
MLTTIGFNRAERFGLDACVPAAGDATADPVSCGDGVTAVAARGHDYVTVRY